MSFCSYSSQVLNENKTSVDNMFIDSFLPHAQADCVKVYIYGLYACNDANSTRNNLSEFSKVLKMSEDDIYSAFLYWQEEGLVTILDTMPFTVKYLPVKNAIKKYPKHSKTKYANFNAQIQEILGGRMITPTEFYEYYYFLEQYHMEKEALVMIAKFCVDLKGNNVNYPYILRVAKDWANENILSSEDVNNKLLMYETKNSDLALVLKQLKIKRSASIEERDMFDKWQTMGFELGTIIHVCKQIQKDNASVKFSYVDKIFEKYFAARVYSIMDIDDFEKQRKNYFNIAKTVCKNIGVYYENYQSVVETYITNWFNLGYDEQTILKISEYCFKSNIKTLAYVDSQILKFYKLGIVSTAALENYLQDVLKIENNIKNILQTLHQSRNVNNHDRDCYRNWTSNWNFTDEMIMRCAEIAKGKPQPFVYMNKILSSWHAQNITKVDQIKDFVFEEKSAKKQNYKQKSLNYEMREYTKEEINAMFTNLDDIEI